MVHDSWRRFPGHFFLFFPELQFVQKKGRYTRATGYRRVCAEHAARQRVGSSGVKVGISPSFRPQTVTASTPLDNSG